MRYDLIKFKLNEKTISEILFSQEAEDLLMGIGEEIAKEVNSASKPHNGGGKYRDLKVKAVPRKTKSRVVVNALSQEPSATNRERKYGWFAEAIAKSRNI